MTSCMLNLCRRGLGILRNQQVTKCCIDASRQLYSLHSLGLIDHLTDRSERQSMISDKQELISSKLKLLENSESDVSLDDVEDTVLLVEKDPVQVDLLSNIIKKYNKDKCFKLENIELGLSAMRTLHHLNEPKVALELFWAEKIFFDDLGCFIILMDLLFKNGMYHECREIYEYSRGKVYGSMAPLTIVFAACCKQNTDESFDYAYKTFRKLQLEKFKFPSKVLSFLAALALKQQRHDIVLQVINRECEEKNVVVIKNILLETFVQVNRLQRVRTALNASLKNFPNKKKERFYKDVFENIETAVAQSEFRRDVAFHRLLSQIRACDLVVPTTLEENLFEPITIKKPKPTSVDCDFYDKRTVNA